MEVLQAAYKRDCEELNEEDAAAFARKIRDKLLCDTDNRVALDRFNISVPSNGTFTAWLTFLKSLGGGYYESLGDISAGAPRSTQTRGQSKWTIPKL